jgi:hypothetical protein
MRDPFPLMARFNGGVTKRRWLVCPTQSGAPRAVLSSARSTEWDALLAARGARAP